MSHLKCYGIILMNVKSGGDYGVGENVQTTES